MTTSKKKNKGILTVEAALILPVFIMVMCLVLSLMKLCYFHLVMQQSIQNVGTTLAEYGYLLDRAVGIENLSFKEGTAQKESKIKQAADEVIDSFTEVAGYLKGNIELSTIPDMIEAGMALGGKAENLIDTVKTVEGEDIVNYLLVSSINQFGGNLVQWMVGDYLSAMGSKNKTIQNIRYEIFVEEKTKDILLYVYYDYDFPYFMKDKMPFRQMVRVHPWVGGERDGLYTETLFQKAKAKVEEKIEEKKENQKETESE